MLGRDDPHKRQFKIFMPFRRCDWLNDSGLRTSSDTTLKNFCTEYLNILKRRLKDENETLRDQLRLQYAAYCILYADTQTILLTIIYF